MAKKAKKRRVNKKTAGKEKSGKRRIWIIITNLVLFSLLSLVCLFFYNVSTNPFYVNLFFLLTFVLAFVAVAFLIALLILVVMKGLKR